MTYELQGRAAHPLIDLFEAADFPLADLIPTDSLAQVFDGLYYTEARAYPSGMSSVFDVHLAFENELALEPAGDEGPAIVFGETAAGWTVLETNVVIGPESSVSLVDVPISLRIPPDVLRDVRTDGPAMLTMTADFRLSSDSGFCVLTDDTLTLAESEVAGTGVTVSAGGITWNFNRGETLPEAVAAGISGEFIGLGFREVKVKLPPDFAGFPDFSADYCVLGTGGVSGRFHATYAPVLDPATKRYTGDGAGVLFGIPLALFDIQIEIKQTALTTALLKGKLLLPFFDEYVDVEIGINLNGSLNVRLSSPDGLITLTKPGLLKLQLESIQFEVVDGVFRVKLGGELTPLIGTAEGIKWPSFHVDELSIDSNGKVHLAGGWLNLRKKYEVDFNGFKIEVSKLGFGNSDDGGKWIGFSGGVKLVAGMPAGASVEGLRFTWYDDGRAPKISLNGVRVEFEVPNALKFTGSVSYDSAQKQFSGAVKLDLIALRMQVDATAVFGTNNGQPYLALYLAAEFPAGIPLFATGLGIYGVAGLFAMNMEPNRAVNQPWYELGSQTDWYHSGDAGVTSLAKWKPQNGSMAFGAGVTLGTIADNGHTFSGKMLLAIVFPGPILMLQGSASLLQERTQLDKDANFSALAVLDGRAGTLQVGLDAQYRYDKDNGNLIDIHGAAEGFFNFNDPNAWRLNVGLKEPRDRRLTARLFKLFDSYSYVMLDSQQLAMGAWVGFQQQWQFGPLNVGIEAWIDGNARVSWKPAHFYGDLSLHGSARLSVFGFSAGLTVDAMIAADVFDPLHIRGDFRVGIDLPWPLSDIAVNVNLEWGPQPSEPPLPLPLKEIAVEHFKASTSWPLSRVTRGATPPLLLPNYDPNGDGFFVPTSASPLPNNLDHLPVVPLDSRPHLTFARNINDDALVGVNAQAVSPEFERIGDPIANQGPATVRYGLNEIVLEKFKSNQWTPVARKGTNANPSGLPTLFGSWAPVPQMPGGGGRNVGQTKLWLWSKTPFEYTRHSSRAWDEWFVDANGEYPCGNLPGKGWNFENIDPNPRLSDPWRHPDEPELQFTLNNDDVLSIRELDRPSHGFQHAFGITGNDTATITLPEPTNLVRVLIPDARLVRDTDFEGQDSSGEGAFRAILGGTPDRPYMEIRGKKIFGVRYNAQTFRRFTLAKNLGRVRGATYNPELYQVIFVEFDGKLSAVDVTTGDYKILGDGYDGPIDVALSADRTTAYITENAGTLLRVDLTGGSANKADARVVTKGMNVPCQIALDEENGKAYVVEFGGEGRLLGIDLVSGNQTTMFRGLSKAFGLILADDRATAYVTELGDRGRFSRITLATGARKVVYDQINEAMFLSWANDAHDAVITMQPNPDGNSLIRMDLAGRMDGPEFLYFNFPGPSWGVVRLPNDRYVVTSETELTMFATTLLIPSIVDVGGNLLVRHFEDEITRWTQAGEVLEPHSTYRLKVVTTIKARGDGQLAGYSRDETATEFAYFRTDGPPGVALLSAPVTAGETASPQVSPLNDLSRYVRRTMPAVAAPTPQEPLSSRLFYRAYDLGVELDENYVDLMYRLGRRDLSLQLHDGNGAIRNDKGRRLVLSNQWGRAETVTLSDHEERWLSVLGDGGCVLVPLDSVVKNSTLNAASVVHLLPPASVCEARLIPALLHDDFGSYSPGGGADGPNGKFDRWQVRDDPASIASRWRINKKPATEDFEWDQTVNTASSSLVYGNTTDLAASHPDQPSNWTDYRLTVALRFTGGRAGIVWRYRDAANHYRFVMQDRKCELIRVAGGVATVLATGDFTIPGDTFVISVEAVGSSLRVYQGEGFILSATDATIASGSAGFYSSGTASAAFSDIYVDDFRNTAPVVYRFSFLSSRFRNFKDHVESFDKKTRLETILASANVAPFVNAAGLISDAPVEAELRAFDGLLAQLPGVAASSSAVRVTRVEQGGIAIAFVVQSPEPLDWRRINLRVLRAPLKSTSYTELPVRVLRKADGAGLVIVSPSANAAGSLLPPGEYRLEFTYRRNNRAKDPESDILSEAGNTSPEVVTLDVSWETPPARSEDLLFELLAPA